MLNFRSSSTRMGLIGVAAAMFSPEIIEAQNTTWTAPSSGYVQDFLSRSVRPVAGFVGSAVLGPAVLQDVDWVSLAPNQKSGIVQRGGSLVWIPDFSEPLQSQVMDRVPLARQAFWSTDATRAVMLTAAANLIWLTNFNSSPGTVPTQDATWALSGFASAGPRGTAARWTVLAVDAAADRVLLTAATAAGVQLWMASRTVPPVLLIYSGRPVAAVFAAGSETAFLADADSHAIVRLRNLNGTPVAETVLTSPIYVNEPASLALSADDMQLFIADRTIATIRLFDASSGTLTAELLADAIPVSLTRLTGNRFLLNTTGLGAQSLLFLDTTSPARVSFVPRGN